jgi:hypothetical protein
MVRVRPVGRVLRIPAFDRPGRMLLVLPWAWASGFSESLSDWQGDLDATSQTLTDGEMTFEPGVMASFSLTARVRLVDGNGFAVQADETALVLNYTASGGVSLGDEAVAFSVGELAWQVDADPILEPIADWEQGGLTEPEIIAFADGYFLYYTGGGSAIGVATSSDLLSWTRFGSSVLTGASPTAVVDGDTLVLFYGCDGAICRATTEDGLTFLDDGVVADSGDRPSVVLDETGTWHLWTTDADGTPRYQTSTDGLSFSDGETVDDRLAGLDALSGAYGFEGVYPLGDSLGWTVGGADPTFTSAGTDLVPLLEDNDAAWSDGGLGDATALVDGTQTHVFYSGGATPVIGHAVGAPAPGNWAGLTFGWDGTTLTASWDEGPTLSTTLDAAGTVKFTADGTLAFDEIVFAWDAPDTADTADTGADTGDTGVDTGDTGADTAGGTGLVDTAGGTGDTVSLDPMAAAYFEPGGFGCSSAGGFARLLPMLAALSACIRRSR